MPACAWRRKRMRSMPVADVQAMRAEWKFSSRVTRERGGGQDIARNEAGFKYYEGAWRHENETCSSSHSHACTASPPLLSPHPSTSPRRDSKRILGVWAGRQRRARDVRGVRVRVQVDLPAQRVRLQGLERGAPRGGVRHGG
eukprot:1081378-Rhodomonas_salina.3